MKNLGNLSEKDQAIVDTILTRCQREWVSIQQLTKEFNLPNSHHLAGYFQMLRAEGYVIERRQKHQPKTNLNESWYRIVDFKEKKVKP